MKTIDLSAVQSEIYLDQVQDPNNPRYNIGGFIRLGAVDVERIAYAHELLVKTDDVFGTRISAAGLHQHFSQERTCDLPLVDLSALPDPTAAAWRHVDELFETPFAFFDGELFRARLLKLDAREFWYVGQAHHICMDGWSFANWAKRLSGLYAGSGLPPSASPFEREATRQRDREPNPARVRAEQAYWKETLTALPEPFLNGRPARRSGRWSCTLNAAQQAAVRALAARLNASNAHVYAACVTAYLFAVYGQTDVLLAIPVHNRNTAPLKQVLGAFADIGVLRIQFDGNDTFGDLVRQIAAVQTRNLKSQRLPLAQHLRDAGIARGNGPIYQVAFNYVPLKADLSMGETNGQLIYCSSHRQLTPLSVNICEYGESFPPELQLDYNCGFFDDAEIALLGGRLGHMLDHVQELGNRTLHKIDVLPEAEKTKLYAWQYKSVPPAHGEHCLHELFEQQVRRQPDAIALVSGGDHLSYHDLNRRANQLAHYLVGHGVRPDARVAVCLERGVDMIVGLLAILKAGGAYVPLDPAHPGERLAFVLDDCAPVLIVTETGLRSRFEVHVPAVCIDTPTVRNLLAGQADCDLPVSRCGLASSNLAYVIYTSGSTGTPKGVLVEHRQVVRLFGTTERLFGFSNRDTWSLFHSFAFDFSVWELWGALAYGGKAVIVPSQCTRSAPEFFELVCAEGVTVLNQTPSAFKQFQAAQEQTQSRHALRFIVFGGEALDPRTLVPWVRRNSLERTQLINMYGITETTVHVTCHKITEHDLGKSRSPIGKPLEDLNVLVLNTDLRPLPIGVCGELYVGGAGVARGYLNRPELTAARFLSDPSSSSGARLYRTGDLGRWLPDGSLEYLGRNDAQVKIRGFRIEPGEIETTLTAIPGVDSAVVVVREDSAGDKRLVAYLVQRGGTVSTPADLRAALATTLPDYMLPSAFVTIDAFPLTPNGKLDHKALPAPHGVDIAGRDYEAPQGRTETLLAAIWQELLGIERVGRNDHFFELGGHSLLAVQVASRVRDALGVNIALGELFAQPVLSRLAAVVDLSEHPVQPALPPIDRNGPLPVSPVQQRLWFLAQLDPLVSAAYHMPAALRMHGRLERAALFAALDRIVTRHEILRTTFSCANGEITQRIGAPKAGFPVRVHDLRAVPAPEQDALVKQIGAEESSARFDLEAGPLARARLVQLGEHEHLLFVTLHHIVADGWSIGVLAKELTALYRAFIEGVGDPLPPLPCQYADVAVRQRQALHQGGLERHARYWRGQLRDAPVLLQLPTDRPRPPRQSHVGATARLRLDATQTGALLRLGQREGATLFMTLLASWAVLLARLSGQDDVVIGTPTANRRILEVERLVGPFVNMLPLRVRLAADPTVAELIAQIRQTTLEGHEHQDLPFEEIIATVGGERDPSYSPLFQSALVLDNTPAPELILPGLTLLPWEPVYVGAKQDLSLHVLEDKEGLDCTVVYSTALFDPATVEAFMQYWRGIVASMCDDHDARLSRLGASEVWQLDGAARRAHPVVPAPSFIHFEQRDIEQSIGERFVAQVRLHRDAPAVISADRTLSYGELFTLAQQVARRVAVDVREPAPVGLLLSHDEDMVVGIVGALLAGRCYVPLDPDYPRARLEFMVRDSGMTRVITNAAHLPLATRIAGTSVEVLTLESALTRGGPACPPEAWRPCATPDSIAYILYTSGSTGQPKGIVQNHRNALYFCSRYTNNLAIAASDRVALLASFSFDAAVMDLFGALLNGACLVPIHPTALDAGRLVDYLAQRRITIYHSTPTLYRHLFGTSAGVRLPDVRLVVMGGESVSRSDLDVFVTAFADHCVFVNGYGPTESTLALQRFLDKQRARSDGPISAGHPVSGTAIRLGHPDTPIAPFQCGEIYIRSGHVALCYHRLPELTASAFGMSAEGVRYYRTGDIGRVLADGSIQILGRADNQIKLRGIRIEPGDIEARLKHCSGVREAVVVLREDVPGEPRLVAYILADGDWEQLSLAEQLGQVLPGPMVPSTFVQLEHLPLTPSGKIDRRALPAPAAAASVQMRPPVSDTERGLAGIWAEHMRRDAISVHDNFFAAGGNSLLLIQVLAHINQQFNLNLSMSSAMQFQTIETLAKAIDELLVQQAAQQRLARTAPRQTGIRI